MATVTFNIRDALATELNQISVAAGFPNAKAMVVEYLKAEIRAYRGSKALIGIREAAEAQAIIETKSIS
mgnify:CR=1 FL=1